MSSFAARIAARIGAAVPALGLATAGIAAWFLSSFFTPYIATSEHAMCLVPANETTSIIGWVLAIFGLSTAFSLQRGTLQLTNKRVAMIVGAMVAVALATSAYFVGFQQTTCSGY